MPDCCCSNSLWFGIYFERDLAFQEVWERDGLSCSNCQHPFDGSPGSGGDDWIYADDVLVLFERAPNVSQRNALHVRQRLQGLMNSRSGCCTETLSLIEHSVISITRGGLRAVT